MSQSNSHHLLTNYKIRNDQEEWYLCNNVLIMPHYLKHKVFDEEFEMFLIRFSANESEPIEHKVDTSTLQMFMFTEAFRKSLVVEYFNERSTTLGSSATTFTINDIACFKEFKETPKETKHNRKSTDSEENSNDLERKQQFYARLLGIPTSDVEKEVHEQERITIKQLTADTNKNSPLVIDISKFDINDDCIFALFEKTSKGMFKLTPFIYHNEGYCYENTYLNNILKHKLGYNKVMTSEEMKMDITGYKKENDYKR